jgi:hypothetical protein
MTPYVNQWANVVAERSRQDAEAQTRMKELMAQHIFEDQSQQKRLDWYKNNMTAHEQAEVNIQQAEQKRLAQEALDNGVASGKYELAPPPTQQSPAQKAIGPQPPSSPGFDFKTMGQQNPGAVGGPSQTGPADTLGAQPGAQGAPAPTSIAGGTPQGGADGPSGDGPSAPPISTLLFPQGPLTGPPGGGPSGNAAANSQLSRASSAQAGPLAQLSQGSTTPSQTGAGQTGSDSGALPSPIGGGGSPSPAGPVYDRIGPDGQTKFRVVPPEEQAAKATTRAKEQAEASRQQQVNNTESFINDPRNAQAFKENPDLAIQMRAFAQTGQKLPIETVSQILPRLIEQHQAQVAAGDTTGAALTQQHIQMLKPASGQNNLGGVNNSGLSEEALNSQADRFNETGGDMVAMGRGDAAINTRTAIINRAAERAAEKEGPVDFAANKGAYRANVKSLGDLTDQHDQVVSFENTSRKNLETFLQKAQDLAAKYGDTGIPWLNTPFRNVEKDFGGNPDIPAYNAARQVAINEIAKVTNNPGLKGQLTDTARKEVENFIPANATLAQTLAVAQVLKQDMENRRLSLEAQIGETAKRLGRGVKSLSAEDLNAESGNITPNKQTPSTKQPRQWFDGPTGKAYSDDGGKTHFDYKTGKQLD